MPKRIFYIECKLKLRYLTTSWKSGWVGVFFNLEILWEGVKQIWKSGWKGAG